MDILERPRFSKNEEQYHIENLHIAREYSKQIIKEMGELVRSIVLFGSNAKNTANKDSDIDLLIVLDNVSVFVTAELREAYRVISTNLAGSISNKLHIMTMNLSDLWDLARKGDPLLTNILRSGLPLLDKDLIEPLQYLLEIGKIKPTPESIYNYQERAKTLLKESSKHLEEAIMDLYYATIDICHAALMSKDITPPSPEEMPEIFREAFQNENVAKCSSDIEEIYRLAKEIEHHKNSEIINANTYNKYLKKTTQLVKILEEYNKKQLLAKKKEN
ncbi:MAG: nucleotidyltransferase domain-containing protein [Candidatus Woesearchaeota archaeon]|nr:nucleotidyltransferase domain-containing protein [Nanoarchaeota archaeon]USN44353.1 MAG: nucleotidyltransferase domain-containing protein [Candidatus Woesearchaeota archaeon]